MTASRFTMPPILIVSATASHIRFREAEERDDADEVGGLRIPR